MYFFLHHCSWCKWCSRAMSGLQISINTKPMMMRLPTCNIIALSRVLEWKCLSSKRHDSAKSPTISSDMRKTYRYVARRTERKTSCRKRGGFICHRFWYYHYLFGIQRDCTSIENDKKKRYRIGYVTGKKSKFPISTLNDNIASEQRLSMIYIHVPFIVYCCMPIIYRIFPRQ